MTRDPKTGTFQCPSSWENASANSNEPSPFAIASNNTTRNVNVIPSNAMAHTISNPWHNPVNQSNFNNFAYSFENKDNKNNMSAFSWIDNAATNSLTENLSELNIRDDRPRPTKIRRRNALTILDQHFPNPNTVKKPTTLLESPKTPVDAFEGASLLESIEENEKLCLFERQNPKRYVCE